VRSFVITGTLAILLITHVQATIIPVYAETEAVIAFDKPKYGPFDSALITITYQPANVDPTEYDSFLANVSTSSGISKILDFNEKGIDKGVFTATVSFTPEQEIWPGELKVERDDDLIVEFTTGDNRTFTNRVDIDFYTSGVRLNKNVFTTKEMMAVFVWDLDMNRKPHTSDTLQVRVWSSTDQGGLNLILRELGANSGIFHENVTFTKDETSSGTRLRVSDGDTITVKYTDSTLPPPAKLSSNGFETVEVEELFEWALIDDCACAPIERVTISQPQLFDLSAKVETPVGEVNVGDQVMIETEITSVVNENQQFVYFIQVKDSDNVTVSLSWIKGELKLNEPMKIGRIWIPDSPGKYTIENFTWESIELPIALSVVRSVEVEVN
jgi:hypothetical protein